MNLRLRRTLARDGHQWVLEAFGRAGKKLNYDLFTSHPLIG